MTVHVATRVRPGKKWLALYGVLSIYAIGSNTSLGVESM